MEREIRFFPAFDKRHKDPNKNYGIHGVNLLFLLKGEKGVIQFLIYTNWQLPHVQREVDARSPSLSFPYLYHQPMAADIGYHSPVPMYEGQDMMTDKCEYLDGKPCYCDGSGLRAQEFFDVLRKEGDKGLWKALEEEYKHRFEDKD